MKCVCCNNNIRPYIPDSSGITHEESVFNSKSSSMWFDGVVSNVSAGYGSRHDGDQFVIAICDDCLSKKKESGTIAYIGNYISNSVRISQDVERYRKIWRRSNNLDDLLD